MNDQPAFINLQIENLNHLYNLVEQLTTQLSLNRSKRLNLLREIDVLFAQIEKSHDIRVKKKNDVSIFNNFLQQRNKEPIKLHEEGRDLHILRQQKEALTELLQEKINDNQESGNLLKFYENSLSDVVGLVRDDIYEYHMSLIAQYKEVCYNKIYQAEDAEFKEYLDNVMTVQDLHDLSRIYGLLFRLV